MCYERRRAEACVDERRAFYFFCFCMNKKRQERLRVSIELSNHPPEEFGKRSI